MRDEAASDMSITATGKTALGPGSVLTRLGRVVALVGVVLPLILIGGLKFTTPEIGALRPLITGTPYLAWLYPVFGVSGASYFLGVVEVSAASLMLASPWSRIAGVAGGAIGAFTFLVTSSLLLVMPAWDQSLGGFPALNAGGQFVIKDVALLGIALVILGESVSRGPAGKSRTRTGVAGGTS